MSKNHVALCRSLSLLLCLLMTLGALAAAALSVSAATVTKAEKSYDIAVVYDNSGSMYNNNSMAWCRAKYAMEIFASMLNYDKDKLHIFPMWGVTTDGTQPASGGSYSAFEIAGVADIDKISNMYTVYPDNTPFEPVTEAYDYLKTSSADEKWLIILTDGDFNVEERGSQLVYIDLRERIYAMASDEIKIQYLGFSGAEKLDADESRNVFSKVSSDVGLKDDLIDICNSIFQRSVLPENRLDGDKLTLDLSMKNVIVFAQGANAKINSLKDSGGKDAQILLDSGQRKYSEIKAGRGYGNAQVDTSLAGQVVTFAACPKGEYTLSCTGAEAIEIFYEPDVSMDIAFVNSDGQRITDPNSFVAGEYTVSGNIIDASTGEDVTSHELMGNNVSLKTFVKTSGDAERKEYANESRINFDPDDSTEVWIEGEYLGKYKISSRDDPSWAWLSKINFEEPTADLGLEVTAEQTWYRLKDHDQWKPIKITLSVNGEPLTDEQLAAANLTITTTDDLKYKTEMISGESAYNVYISRDEAGEYIEPNTGKYSLTAVASTTNKYGSEIVSETGEAAFEIQKYSENWATICKIIICSVVFLLLLIIWLIYMLQKVLPKNIVKDTASFETMSSGLLDASFVDVEYRRKGKSLAVNGSSAVDFSEQCSASFDIRAVDNRFTPSRKRRIAVVGIDSPCDEIKIAGVKYENYEGRWVKAADMKKAEAGKEVSPIDQELSCGPRFELYRSGGVASLTCKTKTIK